MHKILRKFLKKNKEKEKRFNLALIKKLKKNEINISFSQNFEDLIIKRLFPKYKSFYYVDVGANSPIINSNTMLFYLNGAKGINIDAQENVVEELNLFRKKDKNILALIHSSVDFVDFNYHKIPSRSSSDKRFIKLSKIGLNKSGSEINIVRKKTITLTEILKRNNCPKVFNFLNIDVEGSEYNVLLGLNLKIYKPRLIIVETAPPYDLKKSLSKKFRNDEKHIDKYLKKFSYVKLYKDVVNTWYCKKSSYLSFKKKIYLPTTKIIDNFITFSHYQSLINIK